MLFQDFIQVLFYLMFIPAFVSAILVSMRSKRINDIGVLLIHTSTIILTISQLLLAYLLVTLNTEFQIVTGSGASWMSTWQLIAASWTNRWGSYHLWTWVTWIFTSLIFYKYYNIDRSDNSDKLFQILIWGSVIILFLLMGQRPYRAAESTVLVGLTPSLLSIWNILHPPLAFTSYTGYYLSWVIASYIWVYGKKHDKFSVEILNLDIIITRITLVLNSLMIIMGIIWAHESTWGGYWQWDGVQTLAVVLWLTSAYKLHIHKRDVDRPLYLLLGMLGFVIVFFAAYIITSNILAGFHNYASSPIAGLFLLLMVVSGIPIVYGYLKNKWIVISPVKADPENNNTKFTGFNIGILSFNLLIAGNLIVIIMQIIYSIFSINIDLEVSFVFINSLGFVAMTAGLALDGLKKIIITKNNIYILVIIAIVILTSMLSTDYMLDTRIIGRIEFILIFLLFMTIIILIMNMLLNFSTTKKHLSHIAMMLILITVIANGAGATVDTRARYVMERGDSVNTDLDGLSMTLTNISSVNDERGTTITLYLLLDWNGKLYNESIHVIIQEFHPTFVEPMIKVLSNGLEVFLTLAQGDPFTYFGPTITGALIIMEIYTMVPALYLGLILYISIIFIPSKRTMIFAI